jgi:hypothetical protein
LAQKILGEIMRYRLKKWYPSLPNAWKYYNEEVLVTKRGLHYIGNMTKLGHTEVENNPEYWEPIKERNYQIVQLRFKNNTPYNIVSLSQESTHARVKNGHKIHSVKRLSDGEIFTVGDTVTYDHQGKWVKPFVIKYFSIEYNQLRAYARQEYCSITSSMFKKVEQPLFTTEDGVDIYEKDYVWVPQKYPLNGKYVLDGNITRFKAYKPQHYYIKEQEDGVMYFSSKEKSQEYIDYNKPQYSKKDIKEMLQSLQNELSSVNINNCLKYLEK